MDCPARQQISDYLLGKLPEEQLERVAAHLEYCPSCEDAAAELDTLTNSLLASRMAGTLGSRRGEQPSPELALLKESLNKAMLVARQDTASAHSDDTAGDADEAAQVQLLLNTLATPQSADELGRLGGFRLLEVLGVGGMGVVFRGEDPRLERAVALKVVKPAVAAIPSARERFLREARAVAAVEHDHVVTIHQISDDRGIPFLAMPLLEGVSLRERLAAQQRLSLAEVLRIGREVAEGLDAAHQHGLLHRDVKPDNIWLEGERGRVKLLDFGLARVMDSATDLTATDQIVGTPRYMSPEQALGQAVDSRSDLFSLGCVLYRMAAGKPPVSGNSATATLIAVVNEDPVPIQQQDLRLPEAFCRLVDRLLAKQPEDRYQSAREVVAAIQAIEAELPAGPARADNVADPSGERRRRLRNRIWFALAAIPLLVVLGTIITVPTGKRSLRTEAADDRRDNAEREQVRIKLSNPTGSTGTWTPADGWLPLIPLLDPTAEEVRGAFHLIDGDFVSGGTRTLITFPLEIDGDYDVEATIDRWVIQDNHHVDFYLPTGSGQSLLFRMGIDATNTGTGCCLRTSRDPVPYINLPFSPGERVDLLLQVRRTGNLVTAAAYINGQRLTSCSRADDEPAQARWSNRLTLVDLMPGREYHDVRLRMVTGTAEILVSPAATNATGE